MFNIIRTVLYYIVLPVTLIIATLFLPIYLYKDYEKHDYWYIEVGKYYKSIKDITAMFIIG